MMKKLYLYDTNYNHVLINFLKSLASYNIDSNSVLKEALLVYNARMITTWEEKYIEFDTEEDVLVFILKWS